MKVPLAPAMPQKLQSATSGFLLSWYQIRRLPRRCTESCKHMEWFVDRDGKLGSAEARGEAEARMQPTNAWLHGSSSSDGIRP